MPSKKGKGKGKKDKKKKKLRKFDLDLFGCLTFTRYHGIPFEEFMYSGEKGKGKGKGPAPKKGKKGKKKPVNVPKLPMFPPIPEDPMKDMKMVRKRQKMKDEPDVILPTSFAGYPEKTTRSPHPIEEGGSINDVMCGKKYPLPPRPMPHGGVYGDHLCVICKGQGGLTEKEFGTITKKLRKMLKKEFEKAQFIIEWLTERFNNMMKNYENHMKNILDEMGPVLDGLDESEWDDHFEVRKLIEEWRDLQHEMDRLRAELKMFKKNRDEQIAKGIADKLREMEELEKQMLALEKKIQEYAESLLDWQTNAEAKIKGPEAEIAALLERLRMIREGVFIERDTLRQLLHWEMSIATENTVKKMEQVITEDLDIILGWMHQAWFRLFLENRRMQEERTKLRMENHLLELEVQTLARQVDQMEGNKRDIEGSRTFFITPPTLNDLVDKFMHLDDTAVVQLHDHPPTKLLHE